MKYKTKRILIKIYVIISILVFTWLIASWIDVIAHNVSDYKYAWWNVLHVILPILHIGN